MATVPILKKRRRQHQLAGFRARRLLGTVLLRCSRREKDGKTHDDWRAVTNRRGSAGPIKADHRRHGGIPPGVLRRALAQ